MCQHVESMMKTERRRESIVIMIMIRVYITNAREQTLRTAANAIDQLIAASRWHIAADAVLLNQKLQWCAKS